MKLRLLLFTFLSLAFFLPKSVEAQGTYCTPKYSGVGDPNTGNPTPFFTHVLRVGLANMDKTVAAPTSRFVSQFYYDYTRTDTVRLTQTASYPLTIELGNGANRQTVSLWIDFNQNQIFETTERVWSRTDLENQGDHKFLATVKIPKNAVLGNTRMRVGTIYGNSAAKPCTNSRSDNFPAFIADWSQHFQDYSVVILKPEIQVFESANLVHSNLDELEPGTSDNELLRIDVTTNEDGTISPLTADSFFFSLLGSTDPKNVKSAKLYYTGKNPTFNTNTLIATETSPALNFKMGGKRALRQGTNYFWLAIEVDKDALLGNQIDARCNGVQVITTRVPNTVSPPGSRRVGYCVSRGNRSLFVFVRWVRFNTLSVFSGFSAQGYQNFTNRNTTVERGDTVTLTIDIGNGVNNSITRAWIDFNADGDLDDPGEMVLFDSISSANTTPTFGPVVARVPIPANAKIGPTRMRISTGSKSDQAPWKLPPSPCDKLIEIGEVEDYTVIISEEGEPVADFRNSISCLGDSTRFFDRSYTFNIYSINSWKWDFGDGNTSTDQNPVHLYKNPGIYKVSLVSNTNKPGVADTVVKVIQVEDPKVDFTLNTTLSKTPIALSDATSGGTVVLWEWDFGDPFSQWGNQDFVPTPRHQFDTARTYNVKLKVRTLGGCEDSVIKAIKIVDELKPVAVFSASDFEPYRTAPLRLKDLSANRPSSWKWRITPASHNFVNGTDATSQNPEVTLNALTTYTVWLKAENGAGADSTSKTFTTKAYKAPAADFSANQTSVKAGQIVSFLDESTNDPTKWEWVFGDGDSSKVSDPLHEYVKTGTYNVKLRVENPAGNDLETKNAYIKVSDEYSLCESDVTTSPLFKGTLYDAGGATGNYTDDSECGFLIKPKCAGTITLVFTEFLFLSGDYLKVYDGEDNTGTPLHLGIGFTGGTNPGIIRATSGAMYIEQSSNAQGDTTGFKATWSATNNIKPIAKLDGVTKGYVGGQAIFSNTTKVGTSGSEYEWLVNGQIVQGSDVELLHKFTKRGSDTVMLRVRNCAGVDSAMKIITVDTTDQKPKANFAKTDTNRVFVLDVVSLRDLSDFGPSDWSWKIEGDPSKYILVNATSETDQNIDIIFLEPGYYTVSLTASNSYGADTRRRISYFLVEPRAALCSFPLSSSAPAGRLTDDGGAEFPYSSTNCDFLINTCADKVLLTFLTDSFDYAAGDELRIYDGQDANGVLLGVFGFNNRPGSKPYVSNSGFIFVQHTSQLGNPNGNKGFIADWRSIPHKNPKPDFEIPTEAFTGGNFVLFKNTTETNGHPDVRYRWDFENDGINDDSLSFEPIHSFTKVGNTTVKLKVDACEFKDSLTKTILIKKPKAKPKTRFDVSHTKVATTDLVTFSDRSTNGPNKYRWIISPSNFTIANGSDTLPFMSGYFTVADTYDVKLVVGNKFGEDSLVKVDHVIVIDYCIPSVVNAPDNGLSITYVELGDIKNASLAGDGVYNNYTDVASTKLTAGGKSPLLVQRGSSSPRANLKVWIDFDQDGRFTGTDEEVLSINAGNWGSVQDSISIPRNAATGPTRMRVSTALGLDANLPCGPKQFGEYEDYRVIIGADEVKPIITLLGSALLEIEQGETYVDAGATAYDDLDRNLTDSIVKAGSVNTSVVGTYRLTYNVSDLAGNKADEVVRRVIVIADTTRPVLTLVGPDTVKMDVHTSYKEPGYTALDALDGDVTSLVVTDASVVDTFRLDTFEVLYTSTDLSGNLARANRFVVVQDTIKPVITIKGLEEVTIVENDPYVDDGADVNDNFWSGSDLKLVTVNEVDNKVPGTYYVYYNSQDGSKNVALEKKRKVIVEKFIGVGEIPGMSVFDVYPNPATDFVVLEMAFDKNARGTYNIINGLGQTVSSKTIGLGGIVKEELNTSQLESGVYLVELTVGDYTSRRRFTITK